MLTNAIAYLHTTFAYQSAAMQLMVGQANLEAQQLHLRETLPIVTPANTNEWTVAMPPEGITGEFASSNYLYHFSHGHLLWIQPRRAATRGSRPDPADLTPSQIDANGAYQLAVQWLESISVDARALESQLPHTVVQIPSRVVNTHRRNTQSETNNADLPAKTSCFMVSWGGSRDPKQPRLRTTLQASVEVSGGTKQCLALRLQNPRWFTSPPLQLTNAAALLGPAPSPRHYVEDLLGGTTAYADVSKPDQVMAWLVATHVNDPDSKTNRTPAVMVDAATTALLSQTLTDFNSYSWLGDKGCEPDYEFRLDFIKGADRVEFVFSYGCDHLKVIHNGHVAEKDFDPARAPLVHLVQAIFPRDAEIRALSQTNAAESSSK